MQLLSKVFSVKMVYRQLITIILSIYKNFSLHLVLYCKQLGINYKNLSEEEFRWFIRILKKSKKMGTPISQRKKR